jgi:hypothetical protein
MASMGKRIFVVGGKTFANMNEHNGIHSLETGS